MKEDANIAMGLLTANKWQPSVLQLLPFSNNNVGVKRHAQGVHSATYSESGQDREFPMLAVTRSENARPRSKSANVPSESSSLQARVGEKKFDQGQQRRLFRASSERLARGAERTSASDNSQSSATNNKHKNKLRARSDYGISTFHKRPEVVKISVNDINEQILGKNRVRSAVAVDEAVSSKTCDSPNGAFRMRLKDSEVEGGESKECRGEGEKASKGLFPKSALKPSQGRWPNSGLTFWSSAATAPNHANIRSTPRIGHQHQGGKTEAAGSRESNTAPAEVYFRRDGRRVKLNVNELPRSKTPIADNDPDKLNMQHVIAFLQSSNAEENDRRRDLDVPGNPFAKFGSGQLPAKRSAINGVITASPDQNGLVSIRPTQTGARFGAVSPGKTGRFLSDEETEITPHRLSFNKTKADGEKDKNAPGGTNGSESMELYRKTRITSNNHGGILQYSDFKAHSVNISDKVSITPGGYPNLQDIHIPLSIRKIRDSTQSSDTKPFRLHRFLTLVSNGQENLPDAPAKIERSAGGAEQSKNVRSRDKRRAFRNGSGNDKAEKRRSRQRRYHPDSNLYYLDVSSPFNDRPRSKGGSRGSSKSRQDDTDSEQLRKDVQRVIRLPRAHYEADSDEEGSPYCTVPAARNKRALTLSAQGRAIKDIISENNKKLSAALHHADRQASQKDCKPTDKTSNTKSVTADRSSTDAINQETSDKTEEVLVSAPEPKADSHKDSDPNTEKQKHVSNDSHVPLTEKQEITEDQASAVTFRDMLDLRSDPGGSAVSKDTSSPPAADPASTTFLTQAPPSSSPSQSEKLRQSPINTKQQKNSPTRGSPSGKRESGNKNSSPSPTRDHVKLSLRKEKNKTRELTYMFQVDTDGVESFSPSPK
ncbi:hypothetical protein ElyMa_006798100 [Elysia marginata]|uniref:Uncharacterized protein n=1 Tax=Elysia marginata TaxID=1093978 RepID=A0AAV4J6C8_9GAST|nr:hypothetical protein ElyMa_006798100 [Elysia marginata]